MRRYENATGDEQWYKMSKTQVFFAFFKHDDRDWIEIDHLLIVPDGVAASGRATAGTTRAVPDSCTNHTSADRIVANSFNKLPKRRAVWLFWPHAKSVVMECVWETRA